MAAQDILTQFYRPELHGPSALGLDRLVDFHPEHNADYPFACLTPRGGQVLTATWRELSEAVHRAGHVIKEIVGPFDTSSPVVGLLIPDDGLLYTTTQLVLVRIGLIPPMSHLISSTSCSYIVAVEHHIANNEQHDALGQKIATLRLLSEHQAIKMIPQPNIQLLFPLLVSVKLPFVPNPKLQLLPSITRPSWSTVMILHSSGSTKFPKSIHLHRTAFQEWLCAPGDASPPVTGMTISSMAWLKFHAGGVMAGLVPAIAAGMIAGLFHPALPGGTVPQITSDPVYDACLAMLYDRFLSATTNSTMVPQEFSKSPHGLKLLQSVELVLIGGGPLAKGVGDAIVEPGVSLSSFWGSTGVGYTVEWPPCPQGLDWQWQVSRKTVDFHFEPFHKGLYKIAIKSCATHHPSIPRGLDGDEQTERQSHLICMLHPTRPGHFRVLDKLEKQIMRSSSKKTNPYKFRPTPSSLESAVSDVQSTSEVRSVEMQPPKEDNPLPVEQDDGPPVDRGHQAWGYVMATLILETVVWGYVQSYGVFLDYYTSKTAFGAEANASTLLPLVGTINLGTMFCISPLVAGLCNGYPQTKAPSMYGGLLVMALSMIGASFAQTSVQLILTQGFSLGVGEVFVYYTALSYLPEWFTARRGLANGIIFAGSGLGGCIFPFVIQELLDRWGVATTLRCLAIAFVVTIGPAIPFIRPRLPVDKGAARPPIQFETIFGDRAVMKSKVFWVFLASTVLQELSFTLVTLYIPSYVRARSDRATAQAGSAVLAVINGASVISNCGFGALSDRFTPHLLGTCICISSSAFVFALWGGAGAAGYGALITFGFMFGLSAGSWGALLYSVIRECSYNIASAVMLQGIISFARGISNVIAAPISSSLLKLHFDAPNGAGFGISNNSFSGLILFCGLCLAMAGIIEAALTAVRLHSPPLKVGLT